MLYITLFRTFISTILTIQLTSNKKNANFKDSVRSLEIDDLTLENHFLYLFMLHATLHFKKSSLQTIIVLRSKYYMIIAC